MRAASSPTGSVVAQQSSRLITAALRDAAVLRARYPSSASTSASGGGEIGMVGMAIASIADMRASVASIQPRMRRRRRTYSPAGISPKLLMRAQMLGSIAGIHSAKRSTSVACASGAERCPASQSS